MHDLTTPNVAVLLPAEADKVITSRLGIFAQWLDAQACRWWQPDLSAYRDWLLAEGKHPATVQAYLGTVRQRYAALLRQRDLLYSLVPAGDFQARKAAVDELVQRIENAIHPKAASVKVPTTFTAPDDKFTWLDESEAKAVIKTLWARDLPELIRRRDVALVTLALTTGLRAAELCTLDVPDLDSTYEGQLAVHVRQGKGCVERVVPYGDMMAGYIQVYEWLAAAGITQGRVFRGFYPGHKTLRASFSVRAFEALLAETPVMVDGQETRVTPHDLRRTYARWLHDTGHSLNDIRIRLGHKKIETTIRYLGNTVV